MTLSGYHNISNLSSRPSNKVCYTFTYFEFERLSEVSADWLVTVVHTRSAIISHLGPDPRIFLGISGAALAESSTLVLQLHRGKSW